MNINPSLTRALSRGILQVQKHSPVALTGVGVLALVGAGVLAAKATLKLEATLDHAEDNLRRAKELVENGSDEPNIVGRTITKNAIDVAKLYWMPASIAIVGVVCVLSGHHILNRRYVGMAMAYKGLETAYANYRQRIVEKYGEEVDKDIRLGIRTDKVEGENGKKTTVTTVDRDSTGEYIFSFGPENSSWVPNYDHNLFFLSSHQTIFNDILRARGHLFLSEVLDALGIERTPASVVTGWLYDADNPNGDNFIDLGIKDLWATEGYILLDINVDGSIWDKI